MGAFLARPEDLGQIKPEMALMFCHPLNSFTGWVIMYVTGSPWSHVAFLTGSGTIFEATPEGQIERSPDRYFNGGYYLQLFYLPRTEEQRAGVRRFINRQMGAGYNLKGVIKLGLYAIGVVPSWDIFVDVLIWFMLLAAIVPLNVAVPLRLLVLIAMSLYIFRVVATRLRIKKAERLARRAAEQK
jgi:hypothetical protein